MTLAIVDTTLCWCLHVRARHDVDEKCAQCACRRFQAGSRKSSHHYQRGQATGRKRVARLEPGDVILVGFPGHHEVVRGADGEIVWTQDAGSLTSYPLTRHVKDTVLRDVASKTGALLATVTGRRRLVSGRHVIETDLGELPPLNGATAVHVLTERSPW